MLHTISNLNKCCSFELSVHHIILKKWNMYFTNILNSATVFNIDNNKKCLLSTKSECFLKDHVTLKTGVMASENSVLYHMNKLHFKI